MTDSRKRIAAAIRDHIARQRLSREQFAFKTKLGKSTVDKLLIGLFSERTLAVVESHTGLALRPMLEEGQASTPATALASLDRPSIAVLPLANLGTDPGQEYFADGLTEDIITGLARLRWLFVIARNSTFALKGQPIDVCEVGRQLGVRYVLEGSVRTVGGRVRVTGQLLEAETGKQIWAERYDRELKDIFSVQDEITERVVAAVEPHLYAEEGFRAAPRPPDSIDTWGLVVRALALLNRVERRANAEAKRLLELAIAREPTYGRAHALLAWAEWWATLCLWGSARGTGAADYDRAAAHAQNARAQDASDPWARMVAGLCLSTQGHHERALRELQMALELNPSFALGHTAFGWGLLRAGHFDEAIVETEHALILSPLDSFAGLYTTIHGLALLSAGRFEEALSVLRASVSAFNDFQGHYNTLISCCGHLGLIEEAREAIAISSRIAEPLTLTRVRQSLSKFAHCEVFVEGLRKAGVPE